MSLSYESMVLLPSQAQLLPSSIRDSIWHELSSIKMPPFCFLKAFPDYSPYFAAIDEPIFLNYFAVSRI